MCRWRPLFPWGGFLSLVPGLAAWAGAFYAVTLLPKTISSATFWYALLALALFLLGVLLLYWSTALFSLHYLFDRNGLIIRWGLSEQILPMNYITAVRPWKAEERVPERGLRWPGCHLGHARSPELGLVRFFATAGRSAQLLVCTPESTFVLSPRDPERFVQELELRRELGVTRQLARTTRHRAILGLGIWRERPLWVLLVVALLANLALWGLLCYRFPGLAAHGFLTIRYREVVEEGQRRIIPEVIGRPVDLFRLPAFGLLLLGGNTVLAAWLYRDHRLLTYALGGTAVLVQILFWVQAAFVLGR
ncbi:MAG: PH domain-containing protein [Chloroflexia bacterium]